MSALSRLIVEPGGQLSGQIRVPGDKSISHRAVMFGSIAHGETEIIGCLMGEDVRATIQAFRMMGVRIDDLSDGRLIVHGRGYTGLGEPADKLDMGNSGTSIRLLCGLLAGRGFEVTMTGDASLCRRPMLRVTEPLGLMGAEIRTAEHGTPPLTIKPMSDLHGIRYRLPVASAQVKSAIILAGLAAQGSTCVIEPVATRNHTEHMLRAFGVTVTANRNEIRVDGPATLSAARIVVPGDISSAAFFIVGAAMLDGAELTLRNIGINPTRIGVIEILRRMGASITFDNESFAGSEPIADINVRGQGLKGIDIPPALVPSAIDEFPAIFIAAACATGVTRLSQAAELRHKESDRIDAMASGLRALGGQVTTQGDGVEIVGRPSGLDGGSVEGRGDHRIAMAFAFAALRAKSRVEIIDCAAIGTSFPGFVEIACKAGLKITKHE